MKYDSVIENIFGFLKWIHSFLKSHYFLKELQSNTSDITRSLE